LQRIEDGLTVLQKDFGDHRENTELHAVRGKGFLNRCPFRRPNSLRF
jgi:hypothetical protein